MGEQTEMGYLYVLMGKSGVGKDSICKRLLACEEIDLYGITLYTTRPMRQREVNGREYNFVDIAELERFRAAGRLVEERCFNTVAGLWYYFTVNDGSIDLDEKSYITINTLDGFNRIKAYYGEGKVIPIYIEISDIERIRRAVRREEKEAVPKVAEVCRRFLADNEDFSEERLAASGVNEENRFLNNDDIENCVNNIVKSIGERNGYKNKSADSATG